MNRHASGISRLAPIERGHPSVPNIQHHKAFPTSHKDSVDCIYIPAIGTRALGNWE
jgi:hypothetical protein